MDTSKCSFLLFLHGRNFLRSFNNGPFWNASCHEQLKYGSQFYGMQSFIINYLKKKSVLKFFFFLPPCPSWQWVKQLQEWCPVRMLIGDYLTYHILSPARFRYARWYDILKGKITIHCLLVASTRQYFARLYSYTRLNPGCLFNFFFAFSSIVSSMSTSDRTNTLLAHLFVSHFSILLIVSKWLCNATRSETFVEVL